GASGDAVAGEPAAEILEQVRDAFEGAVWETLGDRLAGAIALFVGGGAEDSRARSTFWEMTALTLPLRASTRSMAASRSSSGVTCPVLTSSANPRASYASY